MLYVVIKHENLIDTDEVSVIVATDTKENAYKQLLMEAEKLYETYIVIEDTDSAKKFTDKNQEIFIEISIHETMFINW
ncbi:MAG: hypothetical protein PQJ44_01205 [Sphaerochaetaceae bacterium]|nr:hypothetical protein [Sphaerochaetaceae bacterium]